MRLDARVLGFVASRQSSGLEAVCGWITLFGGAPVCFLAYAFALTVFWTDSARVIVAILSAELIALAVLVPVRYVTRRQRPDPSYHPPRFVPWHRFSFPSQHAVRVFFLAVILGAYWPRAFPGLIAGAALIACTRVCLRRHYLSDVLAGSLLGALLGAAVVWVLKI